METYHSSPSVKRSFCSVCGANAIFHREGQDIVKVAVGLLDAAEGARAETWLEWHPPKLYMLEDSVTRNKSLTLALEDGLREFESYHRDVHDTSDAAENISTTV